MNDFITGLVGLCLCFFIVSAGVFYIYGAYSIHLSATQPPTCITK